MQQPDLIYKIVSTGLWLRAQEKNIVPPMPVDKADGYMHFSTARQLPETLSLHFAGKNSLVLLAVKVAVLIDDLKWETSRGGDLFPHLYADLPTDAIVWHEQIDVAADGTCALPERVQ